MISKAESTADAEGPSTARKENCMLNDLLIEKFRPSLRGEVIEPKDDYYDNACKLYNGMINKSPAGGSPAFITKPCRQRYANT